MENFLLITGSTFLIMLIAEFGDKTNLIALSLMTSSNRPYFIALMSTIGIALSTILSVILGLILGSLIPFNIVRIAAALIFIGLGIVSLLDGGEEDLDEAEEVVDELSDNDEPNVHWYTPIYLVFLAEFGDKSQVFVISAAASTFPIAVFIGSVLGMGVIMFATAIVGSLLMERIDDEYLEKIGGILFIIAGLWIGITTLVG